MRSKHLVDVTSATGNPRSDDGARGRIQSIVDRASGLRPYFIYLPTQPDLRLAPVVSVHGWTRNAAEHVFRFADAAEAAGATLIAPLFTREEHKRYQRLDVREGETCPAIELDRILADVQRRFGLATHPINLFGFSGGAQFAHRYAMMRPGRVRRLGLMAAGWYTMPDPEARYPYGLKQSRMLGKRTLDIDALLSSPTKVWVGERDIVRDGSLKQGPKVDPVQGYTRVKRAETWVRALKDAAAVRGISSDIQLQMLKGAQHDFGKSVTHNHLAAAVFAWFTHPDKGIEE